MKRYGYLLIYTDGDHLRIQSTKSDSLTDFADAFAQRPASLATQGRYHLRENYLSFTHLKADTDKVYWWALQYFCETGWEPFSTTPKTSIEGNYDLTALPQVHLRKELAT